MHKKIRKTIITLLLSTTISWTIHTPAIAGILPINRSATKLEEPVIVSQEQKITKIYYHKIDGRKKPYKICGFTTIEIKNPNDVICGMFFETEKTSGMGAESGLVLPRHTRKYRVPFCGEPEDLQNVSVQCWKINNESAFVEETIEWYTKEKAE